MGLLLDAMLGKKFFQSRIGKIYYGQRTYQKQFTRMFFEQKSAKYSRFYMHYSEMALTNIRQILIFKLDTYLSFIVVR